MTDAAPQTFWVPTINTPSGPMYRAIADALMDDIKSGRLPEGSCLPPQRALAKRLNIDFTTVTRAYAEVRRSGLIEGRVGHGTYVCKGIAPQSHQTTTTPNIGMIDMSMNSPPLFNNPVLLNRMWDSITELKQHNGLGLFLRYQEAGGALADREAGAIWLRNRLNAPSLDRILVCPGTQSALLALFTTMTIAGDTICTESLTYPGVKSLSALLRLNPIGVPLDDDGLIPEAFEDICRQFAPKLLCCTPTLQNPTTRTWSLSRRQQILEISLRYNVMVIEDDAYGALPTAPPPPLAALAPDQVFYIAGLSKPLSPALRISYLILPPGRAAARLSGAIRATSAMASPLNAAIATRWIEDGTAEAVLTAIREETLVRQKLAAKILPRELIHADPEGFHIWLDLPRPWTRSEFSHHLRSAGISVVSSEAFAIAPTPPEAVRLGLGAASDIDVLKRSLSHIADLLSQTPANMTMVV